MRSTLEALANWTLRNMLSPTFIVAYDSMRQCTFCVTTSPLEVKKICRYGVVSDKEGNVLLIVIFWIISSDLLQCQYRIFALWMLWRSPVVGKCCRPVPLPRFLGMNWAPPLMLCPDFPSQKYVLSWKSEYLVAYHDDLFKALKLWTWPPWSSLNWLWRTACISGVFSFETPQVSKNPLSICIKPVHCC